MALEVPEQIEDPQWFGLEFSAAETGLKFPLSCICRSALVQGQGRVAPKFCAAMLLRTDAFKIFT